MTSQDTRKRDPAHDGADEQGPKVIWAHSLAAAAVCVGTGAAIALIRLLG
jgi:hypothetical protein